MTLASSVLIGGASPVHGRNAADFYPTPPECTQALCNAWLAAPQLVWEPACGDGAICRVLEGNRHVVFGTDLHDRGYGTGGLDFLTGPALDCDCIITNPPFNLAEKFIRRARTFNAPFAMLLKATFWHAASRQALFHETGPSNVFAMTWRPNFAPDRGAAPTMDMIWTTWASEPRDLCAYKLLAKPVSILTTDNKEDIFA